MREIKFRFVIAEKHPPFWEERLTMVYATLDELLKGKPDELCRSFTPIKQYKKEYSHGGRCLLGKDEFIGLKDKNGKEIYEEDIVKCIGFVDLLKVTFKHGSFLFGDSYAGESSRYDREVIGNTYENPELLGKEGK